MGPRLLTLLLVVLAAVLAWAAPAGATVFTVTNAGDTGAGSLRQAILDVNATSAGEPHDIRFSVASIGVANALPAITRAGTFVDGCGVGRGDFNVPRAPTGGACTHLFGGGLAKGLVVRSTTGVRIQDLRMTGFSEAAVHLWGASSSIVAGNRFGLLANGTAEGNARAIKVTGYRLGTAAAVPATGNLLGGTSSATDVDAPACDQACNLIANSSVTGIDLVGTPGATGETDTPAGGADGEALEGTNVKGNWIGVRTAAGALAANARAVDLGGSHETTLQDNVVSGNTVGVDQGSGTTGSWLNGGIFGLSPDQNTVVPNGDDANPFHVRLRGGAGGTALVQNVTFGPARVGLQLDGPGADVNGSSFRAPAPESPERFTTAAIRLGPGANGTFLGSTVQLLPGFPLRTLGCAALLGDGCNSIGFVAEGAYGILVQGADAVTLRRNSVGGQLSGGPIEGTPVRFEDGPGSDEVTGALIGLEAEEGWNDLWRATGPAVEVAGGATGVEIRGNGGIAATSAEAAASRFTDLLPPAGPGNTGGVNGGIQPPAITQASVNGIGGTATPGAKVRVIQLQRPVDLETTPGEPAPGYTFPVSEEFATADPTTGVWGVTFAAPLKAGQKLLASQTVGTSTSEFAAPQDATQSDPDPIATITSGPTGLIASTAATFTFVADKVGSTFQCSLDGAPFEPCTTPKTYTGLEAGGHQFRVRAVDPTLQIGPPASRSWTIELPPGTTGGGTTPGGTTPGGSTPGGTSGPGGGPSATPSRAPVALSSVLALPSAKRCLSRRALRLRLKAPKGTGIAFARITVPGKAPLTIRGRKISAPVNLRGLPRGKFKVSFRITLLDGRVVKGSRTYRTCAPKRR
jgi:hypothetical protein